MKILHCAFLCLKIEVTMKNLFPEHKHLQTLYKLIEYNKRFDKLPFIIGYLKPEIEKGTLLSKLLKFKIVKLYKNGDMWNPQFNKKNPLTWVFMAIIKLGDLITDSNNYGMFKINPEILKYKQDYWTFEDACKHNDFLTEKVEQWIRIQKRLSGSMNKPRVKQLTKLKNVSH